MRPVTLFISGPGPITNGLEHLLASELVDKAIFFGGWREKSYWPKAQIIPGPLVSGSALNLALASTKTPYALILTSTEIEPGRKCLERLVDVAKDTLAALVYSDYLLSEKEFTVPRPLIDYQLGSVREGFNFGGMFLLDVAAARSALKAHGALGELHWAGWYDLRLKMSIDREISG